MHKTLFKCYTFKFRFSLCPFYLQCWSRGARQLSRKEWTNFRLVTNTIQRRWNIPKLKLSSLHRWCSRREEIKKQTIKSRAILKASLTRPKSQKIFLEEEKTQSPSGLERWLTNYRARWINAVDAVSSRHNPPEPFDVGKASIQRRRRSLKSTID